jgi:MarR family transcriptional regulator for hemolysin
LDPTIETTGFLVVDLARLFRHHFERAIASEGLGITAGEARTLLHASAESGVRQTVLAERMHVEPMTLSAFLDRLEADGLVRRVPDPSDRRAKLVRVTKAGEPLLKRIRAISSAVRERATAGLTPDQVEAVRSMLQAMRGNLRDERKERAA